MYEPSEKTDENQIAYCLRSEDCLSDSESRRSQTRRCLVFNSVFTAGSGFLLPFGPSQKVVESNPEECAEILYAMSAGMSRNTLKNRLKLRRITR